jgi:hypothetical protein
VTREGRELSQSHQPAFKACGALSPYAGAV